MYFDVHGGFRIWRDDLFISPYKLGSQHVDHWDVEPTFGLVRATLRASLRDVGVTSYRLTSWVTRKWHSTEKIRNITCVTPWWCTTKTDVCSHRTVYIYIYTVCMYIYIYTCSTEPNVTDIFLRAVTMNTSSGGSTILLNSELEGVSLASTKDGPNPPENTLASSRFVWIDSGIMH